MSNRNSEVCLTFFRCVIFYFYFMIKLYTHIFHAAEIAKGKPEFIMIIMMKRCEYDVLALFSDRNVASGPYCCKL